ncbi:Hsp20/alpha crystallin family protein [Rhabdobacter roseus]|uniref:HSP20 family protein n=1 Tax=Rhabdobacter roseus TaxID=1655419 RepID=A0A840TZ60_9BACT|nr:Hsp20/alpha crystallin family protein [Rhabdobacter roseus]MBB5285478.1 HSP20 family protein [Rhabdobacter roseus]
MTLVKRNPKLSVSPFDNLVDRLISNDLFEWSSRNFSTTNTTLPAVNIREDDEQFAVEMAAPGLKKEDFKIELNHQVLSISSERKESREEEDQNANYTRREFSYQSFVRSFSLPEVVDTEKIDARYADGVLHVVLPKREEAKPKPARVIEIA